MPAERTATEIAQRGPRQVWDRPRRTESAMARLDRHWQEILQEIRVAQTGVQLLTGFLLTLPFQQRFTRLDGLQLDIYLATVALSAGAATLLIAPVMVHRLLFRGHRREVLVAVAHRCAIAGLLLLGLALVGVTYVIFSFVGNPTAGTLAATVVFAITTTAWVIIPLGLRQRGPQQ